MKPSIHFIYQTDKRSSATARRSKCEIRNDRRIEKTLNGRVNKRPSGPKKEEEEKSDDGVGDALQICKAVDFLWVDLSMAEFHPFVLVLCDSTKLNGVGLGFLFYCSEILCQTACPTTP